MDGIRREFLTMKFMIRIAFRSHSSAIDRLKSEPYGAAILWTLRRAVASVLSPCKNWSSAPPAAAKKKRATAATEHWCEA